MLRKSFKKHTEKNTKTSTEPFFKDKSTDKYLTSNNIKKHNLEQFVAPKNEDIARLAHNLDRVLFSPEVHFYKTLELEYIIFPHFEKSDPL